MSLKVEDIHVCCVPGLPHANKIIRKPEPVGIELRNLACMWSNKLTLYAKYGVCRIWIWDVFCLASDSTMGRYTSCCGRGFSFRIS